MLCVFLFLFYLKLPNNAIPFRRMFEKCEANAILPIDKDYGFDIVNRNDQILKPNKVNIIHLGFKIADHVMFPQLYKVFMICCNKPWKILTEYVFSEQGNLMLPLVTLHECIVRRGENICQICPEIISFSWAVMAGNILSPIIFINFIFIT